MFSRRHPILFFLLAFTTITMGACIVITATIVLGMGGLHRSAREIPNKPCVGIVEINGVISESESIIKDLKRLRSNDAVKAIVVRIDSPGGGIGPSQEIYREVRKTTQEKKVFASMGALAASGGYYVAAATDGIMANPGTITGSIGVVMGFADIQALLEKIGLSPVVIKSGQYKDMGSPVRDMTPTERQLMTNLVDELHQQFVNDIAEGREMDPDLVASFADGRIFTGQTAKNNGFVDRMGNLEDAVDWAGRSGGIEGEIEAVYPREKKFSFLHHLAENTLKAILNDFAIRKLFSAYLYQP